MIMLESNLSLSFKRRNRLATQILKPIERYLATLKDFIAEIES